jgi:hypothetical protein
MPLNISIDVDGTLLDENENVHSQVRGLLENLKAKEHRLQLWSTGGADYALKRAKEKNIEDLFDSFATKPDVAIDDIPESTHPISSVKVQEHFGVWDAIRLLEKEIGDCVEAALCPSRELVSYVSNVQHETQNAKRKYKTIIKPNAPFHPIPFFGNISSARIITVGLNPSSGEFETWRNWPEEISEHELTRRLVGYFRLSSPGPHPWFAELQEALRIVGCSYSLSAAHIDASPWPTLSPSALKHRTAKRRLLDSYDSMLRTEVSRLPIFLRKCKHLKFVIIIGKGNWVNLIKRTIKQNFIGRIEAIEKNELSKWISKNKIEIQNIIGLPTNIF